MTPYFADPSERIQEKEIPDQGDIKDDTFTEPKRLEDLNYSNEMMENGNQRKKLKTNPENDEISHSLVTKYECVPGPSQESTKIREANQPLSREVSLLNYLFVYYVSLFSPTHTQMKIFFSNLDARDRDLKSDSQHCILICE